MDLKDKTLAMVKDDLADIEAALLQNLNPYFELVSQVASHMISSGGKRLRPLLMVLSAKICGNHKKSDNFFLLFLNTCMLPHFCTTTLSTKHVFAEANRPHVQSGAIRSRFLWVIFFSPDLFRLLRKPDGQGLSGSLRKLPKTCLKAKSTS